MTSTLEKIKTAQDNDFEFAVTLKNGYILMELRGNLYEQGIDNAVASLFLMSEESGVKRVLYDAANLGQSDGSRKYATEKFRQVSARMERMASYLPNYPIFAIAKFMSIVAGVKNWKPFFSKKSAEAWLSS